MSEKILIVGGSGAIGMHLVKYLQEKGYEISLLSRSSFSIKNVKTFLWDINKKYIDQNCLNGINHVIQLSGANIAEKRWTNKRKAEIINSRVNATNLLYDLIKNKNISIKSFVSASAIGYYGAVTNQHIYYEDDLPGTDFLANTCVEWERATDNFANLNIRAVKIRTGIVLMTSYGALVKMIKPAKFGFAVVFGSGKQYFPWIYINDLCSIYHKAISDENMQGSYNAVAPVGTTNKQFVITLSNVLKKPYILTHIPSFLLKLTLGNMANTLLYGSKISSKKILDAGFNFQFDDLKLALTNLLNVTIEQ